MVKTGKEEKQMAEQNNNYHEGVPAITVVIDGGWSKRLHKHSYNANSGVSVIFGAATKKLLYIGVRNKYCAVCSQLFGIERKVKYIVSDNASNMLKAFSLSGFEESAASDALMDSEDDTSNESDDDSHDNTTDGDTTADPSIIDEDILQYLPEHQFCFAHTLQLVVKDGMKDIGSSLQKVIAKLQILSAISKSPHRTQ